MSISVIVFWGFCSFLAYGLVLGSFTKKFPYMKNTDVVWTAVGGPLAVLALLGYQMVTAEPVGFLLKPYSAEKRWEIFHNKYSSLDRAYFDRVHG